MAVNLSEAFNKIAAAGATKVRMVPMPGHSAVNGMCQIEILQDGRWLPIVEGITQASAQALITQATSKTLLG